MNRIYLPLLLFIFTLLACGTSFNVVINKNPDDIEIEILYSSSCQSTELYFDTISSIQFYTIPSVFNYSKPEPYTFLTPNVEGKYFFDFFEGHYFYEIITLEGEILFRGTFSYPDDLHRGRLRLAQGRKKGIIREAALNETEYGSPIPNAEVIHTNTITGEEFIHYSDAYGLICIELDAGRYLIEVNHPDFFSFVPSDEYDVFYNYSNNERDFVLERK